MAHRPNFTAQLGARAAVETAARDAGFPASPYSNNPASIGNIRAMLEAVGAGERLVVPGLSDDITDAEASVIADELVKVADTLRESARSPEQWMAVDQVYRLAEAWHLLAGRVGTGKDPVPGDALK